MQELIFRYHTLTFIHHLLVLCLKISYTSEEVKLQYSVKFLFASRGRSPVSDENNSLNFLTVNFDVTLDLPFVPHKAFQVAEFEEFWHLAAREDLTNRAALWEL